MAIPQYLGISVLLYCGIYTTFAHDELERVLALTSDTEVAKTSLRLPKNLMKRLKLYAIESEKSVTGIVTEACDEYLKKKKF